MAVRPLVTWPDPRLGQTAEPVRDFGPELAALVQDLLDSLRAAPGLGITGPHIGVLSRVVVLELTPGKPETFVNPVITEAAVDLARHDEGSISMPGVMEPVERPARVTVRYRDAVGAEHEETATGFRAACLQHEIDQLNGLFWLERLSRLRRDRVKTRFQKLKRGAAN